MKIDKRLNLVIPVEMSNKTEIYVHSTPISSDVFDTYFLPISKTFASIYSEGLGIVGGPRVADKMLRKIARDLDMWDGPTGVQAGLVNEIHRLTNVIAPGKAGWETVPYDEACKKQLIDKDDAAEIEAALIFFTVASAMHRKKDLPEILEGASKLWGARTELRNCTELMLSLPTSTAPASTGVKAVA